MAESKSSEKKPGVDAIANAIKGLRFRTNKALPVLDDSTGKPVIEGGKEKQRYIADLRTMTVEDVLSAVVDGDDLVLVSKDGAKHRVAQSRKTSEK
jgi:hypothetical protein